MSSKKRISNKIRKFLIYNGWGVLGINGKFVSRTHPDYMEFTHIHDVARKIAIMRTNVDVSDYRVMEIGANGIPRKIKNPTGSNPKSYLRKLSVEMMAI